MLFLCLYMTPKATWRMQQLESNVHMLVHDGWINNAWSNHSGASSMCWKWVEVGEGVSDHWSHGKHFKHKAYMYCVVWRVGMKWHQYNGNLHIKAKNGEAAYTTIRCWVLLLCEHSASLWSLSSWSSLIRVIHTL
jgi:hypothetical protein